MFFRMCRGVCFSCTPLRISDRRLSRSLLSATPVKAEATGTAKGSALSLSKKMTRDTGGAGGAAGTAKSDGDDSEANEEEIREAESVCDSKEEEEEDEEEEKEEDEEEGVVVAWV